ncbi:THO complex subunit 6 [Mytilus galloprovincialis]|uniref:THO complex subunit 6 n=1 Tax=Mytilus galloprovincialis TaxID=29158 RepID=A0A8B6E0K7_MYTGA|nr:THO complex subunit 6 [Mytilus galloprovincialis]
MDRDLAARRQLHTTIFDHCYSPCGKYIAAANNYGQIAVFSLSAALAPEASETTWKPIFIFEASEDGAIFTLASTDTLLISGGNGPIKAWKWADILSKVNHLTKMVAMAKNRTQGGPFSQPEINSIVLNTEEDKSEVFAACGDNNIYVWDLESGQQKITLSGHDNYVHSLAVKNGNTCASASEDGTVKIWDTRSPSDAVHSIEPYKNELCARPKFGKWLGCVAMDTTDDWLVCGGGPSLSLWHLRSLTATTMFDTPGACQQCVMFHDDSIISAGSKGYINHWSVNGEQRMEVPCTPSSVFSLSYNSASNNCKVLSATGNSSKLDIFTNFGYKAFSFIFTQV